MDRRTSRSRKNPLLGAAVVKAVLKRQGPGATTTLYEGLLRDLRLTDEEVERFLAEHSAEVAGALQSHGRRG